MSYVPIHEQIKLLVKRNASGDLSTFDLEMTLHKMGIGGEWLDEILNDALHARNKARQPKQVTHGKVTHKRTRKLSQSPRAIKARAMDSFKKELTDYFSSVK